MGLVPSKHSKMLFVIIITTQIYFLIDFIDFTGCTTKGQERVKHIWAELCDLPLFLATELP